MIRSIFGTRSDVYAQRWENQNTNKSGWSPAVRGGWSNKSRRAKDFLPLTDEVIASHLRGDATIGIYPLLPGDTCALLACDFDDGSWALDALAFLDECHAPACPPCWNGPARATEPTCGCSSTNPFPRPPLGPWG